jgi:seryl-tRNA synthetase
MTVDQMRAMVDELNLEKAALERQLNRALPKGKVMSHLIREREEIEKRFNELSRAIARIKLEIRRAASN